MPRTINTNTINFHGLHYSPRRSFGTKSFSRVAQASKTGHTHREKILINKIEAPLQALSLDNFAQMAPIIQRRAMNQNVQEEQIRRKIMDALYIATNQQSTSVDNLRTIFGTAKSIGVPENELNTWYHYALDHQTRHAVGDTIPKNNQRDLHRKAGLPVKSRLAD